MVSPLLEHHGAEGAERHHRPARSSNERSMYWLPVTASGLPRDCPIFGHCDRRAPGLGLHRGPGCCYRTWINVAYTCRKSESTREEEARKLLGRHAVFSIGNYGRWVFQGMADSVRHGSTAGASLKSRRTAASAAASPLDPDPTTRTSVSRMTSISLVGSVMRTGGMARLSEYGGRDPSLRRPSTKVPDYTLATPVAKRSSCCYVLLDARPWIARLLSSRKSIQAAMASKGSSWVRIA